jgi:hypothetical protein
VLAKITRVASFTPVQAGRGHLVVCGDDALAARMVEELTVRYGEQVTVILSDGEPADALSDER